MWQSLHNAWWRLATQHHPRSFVDILACAALHACSCLYRGLVTWRNALYDRGWRRPAQLPCRVVSVGNLTVGGTGKTSCVELIARKLLERGRHVAVLSRGYGGSRRPYWLRWESGRLVVNGTDRPSGSGVADEPQLLAQHLPGIAVLVGPKRSRTGRTACEVFGADTVVLDDGFQHRRLRRDCDIVLLQARYPLTQWAMLPRGPMREPVTALRRAHVVIVTKTDEAPDAVGAIEAAVRTLNPDCVVAEAVHEPVEVIEGLTGQRVEMARLKGCEVGLLSSIGDPQGFDTTVRRLGASVRWHQAFPDHHPYRAADWAGVCGRARTERVAALVTTEKDWMRLRPVCSASGPPSEVPLWVLTVRMKIISGEDALDARLDRLSTR